MRVGGESRRAYWDTCLRDHWGPESVGSLPYGRRFNRWRYQARARVLRRLVRRRALAPARLDVVDIGCGTGIYRDLWRGLGVRSLDEAAAALREFGFELLDRVATSVPPMAAPTDTCHPDRNERIRDALTWPARRSDRVGGIAGAVFYPFELRLASTLRESPAIEIAVCRRSESCG
jgi:SAM-dependent methyltransferase